MINFASQLVNIPAANLTWREQVFAGVTAEGSRHMVGHQDRRMNESRPAPGKLDHVKVSAVTPGSNMLSEPTGTMAKSTK